MLTTRHILATVAFATAMCAPAQAVVLSPMLQATGTYTFTGNCLDCQAAGLGGSRATAHLEVDNVYNFSNWKFSYVSLLFPGTLTSTTVTGFSSDGVLSGLSPATIYFNTVETAVPNREQTASQWVFSASEDGDLYWDLSPQSRRSADFGNNGLWTPPGGAVPEPGALVLVGIALAGLRLSRRRV